MKIKNLLQAPLILEELKRLSIDPTTLDPNTRVKIKDGCLVFEGEKECFVSKAEPIETPLEICKRLYFEGVQFEVCTTKRIQTIPNDFRIDYEYGDVVLYLRGAQKYTLYSKSFDSFVKIIEYRIKDCTVIDGQFSIGGTSKIVTQEIFEIVLKNQLFVLHAQKKLDDVSQHFTNGTHIIQNNEADIVLKEIVIQGAEKSYKEITEDPNILKEGLSVGTLHFQIK